MRLPFSALASRSPPLDTALLTEGQGVMSSQLTIYYVKYKRGAPRTDTVPKTVSFMYYLHLSQPLTFPMWTQWYIALLKAVSDGLDQKHLTHDYNFRNHVPLNCSYLKTRSN